ncbi:hypothetical protein [Polaribacter ponticola]|uniref:Uncharacterized protein n=1 Tax=Polaribacter ponticola TaxID=2978475 RepID=A0ABT5S637_9FLAO|nr:hypothetical protein [Polaribacter sp. MSW5]MDD7913550.1 hypothetical protein [Polaribacter sp. MSW5]
MKSAYSSSVERGILTSTYKREIRESVATSKNVSLSKIKSLMVNNDRLESQTGTILRVSLFAIAIVMISF